MIQFATGGNSGFAVKTAKNPTEYHNEQTRRRGLRPLFEHQSCC